MPRFILISALLLFVAHITLSQSVKKIKLKDDKTGINEEFFVLKHDGQTKHGDYQRSIGKNLVVTGGYKMGKPVGIWLYYDYSGKVAQKVDIESGVLLETYDKQPKNGPTVLGGVANMYRLIGRELNYPREARLNGAEGKVFISFIVDENGVMKDFQIVESAGFGMDEEAIRAFKEIDVTWIPHIDESGIRYETRMVFPVTFKLN